MRLLIVGVLIFCMGCGQGDDGGETPTASLGGQSLPLCFDINHTWVRLKTTLSTEGGPAFSTLTPSGIPVIVFNLEFLKIIAHSLAMVMFVYEHECGHHALGHIQAGRSGGEMGQKMHFKQELAADCYAAQQLRAMNYKSSSITDIIDDIYPWPKDPEHPSGKVRSRHVAACFKAAGEK
jgi:hypothetical protein